MAPTCFPRQMTLRHSRQALCLLLSRPSGARGPAAPPWVFVASECGALTSPARVLGQVYTD